jgi:hypothetical protein
LIEQFHALLVAEKILPLPDPTAARQIQSSLQAQTGKAIKQDDESLWSLGRELIERIRPDIILEDWSGTPNFVSQRLGDMIV